MSSRDEGGGGVARRRGSGLKIGPVTFVFELGGGDSGDPWAHRKGEPRLFALAWTVYLMVSATLTVMGSRIVAPVVPGHAFGVRALLAMAALGIGVLWPMVRLSQAAPARAFRSTAADVVVLLAPMQAIIWPLPLLASWGYDVAGGLAVMFTSWTLLIGTAVFAGSRSRSVGDRLVWMAAVLVLVSAAPVARLALGPGGLPGGWGLASPLSGGYALTWAESGQTARMTVQEWWMVSLPMVVAVVGWGVVAVFGGRVYARAGGP